MQNLETVETTEAAIFGRIFANGTGDLSPALARLLLQVRFNAQDQRRMHELAGKNQDGALTTGEREELANYVKVGHLLSIMHSGARIALRKHGE